jgi:hypothetical protein
VTEAAGFALAVTAWVDPSTREDVQSLIAERMWAAVQAYHTREILRRLNP